MDGAKRWRVVGGKEEMEYRRGKGQERSERRMKWREEGGREERGKGGERQRKDGGSVRNSQ